MIKRRWFSGFAGRFPDLCERVEEVLGPLLFPGGRDCRELDMAARQRVRHGSTLDDHALWAWQARVRQLAESMELGPYDAAGMTSDLIRSVVSLSRLHDGPVQARRLLAGSGIGMVVLHHLPRTHLDGAALLRSDGHPIVATTLRHDRLDNFWFTLAHELAHVVLHLSKGVDAIFMDDLEAKPTGNAKEREADELAKDCLIPPAAWKQAEMSAFSTDKAICDLAVRTHIHPAIVAGRIRCECQNYTILSHLVGNRLVRCLFPACKTGEAT